MAMTSNQLSERTEPLRRLVGPDTAPLGMHW
jgi:hypothetical protein